MPIQSKYAIITNNKNADKLNEYDNENNERFNRIDQYVY